MSNQGQGVTRYFVCVQTVICTRRMQASMSPLRLGTAYTLGAHRRTGGLECER